MNLMVVRTERQAEALRHVILNRNEWLVVAAFGLLAGHKFDYIVCTVNECDFDAVCERDAFARWMRDVGCRQRDPGKKIVWL